MKELVKVALTKGTSGYTTYFYHKHSPIVYQVFSAGKDCPVSIAEKLGIDRRLRFSSELPKRISSQIKHVRHVAMWSQV